MMPLADILFLAIVVYLLYRFINNFLLPIVRATRQVREQFRNMQGPDDSRQAANSSQAGNNNAAAKAANNNAGNNNKRSSKPPAEDYIDFEEIK